jgi:hypothetical protein
MHGEQFTEQYRMELLLCLSLIKMDGRHMALSKCFGSLLSSPTTSHTCCAFARLISILNRQVGYRGQNRTSYYRKCILISTDRQVDQHDHFTDLRNRLQTLLVVFISPANPEALLDRGISLIEASARVYHLLF